MPEKVWFDMICEIWFCGLADLDCDEDQDQQFFPLNTCSNNMLCSSGPSFRATLLWIPWHPCPWEEDMHCVSLHYNILIVEIIGNLIWLTGIHGLSKPKPLVNTTIQG